MRRREFITLLGGAVAGWPLPTRAQQTDRQRRIGVLMAHTENDPEFKDYLDGRGFRNSDGSKAATSKSIPAGERSKTQI